MPDTERRLTLRSGGWVLLLAMLLVLLIVIWQVVPVLRSSSRAVGDGHDVDTYRFQLDPLNVPRDTLAAAGFPKDGIRALVDPPTMRGDAVLELNESRRGKYLVTDDRVIGVVLGGEARAYPIRMLNWHEVINDTLGGIPIAVTYHPLCDSVAIFDRRVAGEVLEFGISGLLYNSNLLIFDRHADDQGESLWSQLLARAVAGPAAAEDHVLKIVPASLSRWDVWLRRYPDTTVVRPDPTLFKRYERNPYGNYYLTGRLRFPVHPLPPEQGYPLMQPMVVIEQRGETWHHMLETGRAPETIEPLPGVRVWIDSRTQPTSVLIDAPPETAIYYSLWFAWYATHPDVGRLVLTP